MSFGKNKSSSSSRPLTANEVASYYDKLNQFSGNRLDDWARSGTEATYYQQQSPDEIRKLGGLGATQVQGIEAERNRQNAEINADPTLSVFQRMRAKQISNDGFADRLRAINAETEAAIASQANREHLRSYEDELRRKGMTAEDLNTLSSIFFGGSGTISSSKGRSFSLGL